jgi:hypothetical protein
MSRDASGEHLQSRGMAEVKKGIQLEIAYVLFIDIDLGFQGPSDKKAKWLHAISSPS